MPDRLVESDDFKTLAAGILQEGRGLRFKARGASMRPFIQDGDLVEVQPVASSNLVRGNVVLCRLDDGRLVVHRIMRAAPTWLLIQGDALPYPDGRIAREQVLGRVDALTRRGRRIRLDSFGMALLVNAWLLLTPWRRLLLRVLSRLCRVLHPDKPLETGVD